MTADAAPAGQARHRWNELLRAIRATARANVYREAGRSILFRRGAMANFHDEGRRKAGLFLLAAACAFVAGNGLHLLLLGDAPMDVVRGGGRVLFWGGIAVALLARGHGRQVAGVFVAMWVGAGLIVVSWWLGSQ